MAHEVFVEIAPGSSPGNLDDPTWVDVTEYLDGSQPVSVEAGRHDEGADVDTSVCKFTLNNTDGRFSPRNPTGPWYGQLGRGTPLQVSVESDNMSELVCDSDGAASTPDHASLDITGPIDIRLDIEPDSWVPVATQMLASKYAASGDNRSWYVNLRDTGALGFAWSVNGSTMNSLTSSVLPPHFGETATGRRCIRVTLDDYAGQFAGFNSTVRFYVGPSIDGPWHLIKGIDSTTPPTPFSGTGPLVVGGPALLVGWDAFKGSIFKAEVRNGVDGTIVASPDFTTQTVGDTSFSDAQGRTWTVTAGSEISLHRSVRFQGFVDEWPQRWGQTDEVAMVPVSASGVLRRMGQGQAPIRSALARFVPSVNPIAYWPMEDGQDATSCAPGIDGPSPLKFSGDVQLASTEATGGSNPLPLFNLGSQFVARVPVPDPSLVWSAHTVNFLLRFEEPAVSNHTAIEVYTASGDRWRIITNASSAWVERRDSDDNITSGGGVSIPSNFYDGWLRFSMRFSGSTSVGLFVARPNGAHPETMVSSTWNFTGVPMARPTRVGVSALGGVNRSWGHVVVVMNLGNDPFADNSDDGFKDETAVDRIARLCNEESIPFSLLGTADGSMPMGPQTPSTVLEILRSCEAADDGVLFENGYGLGYVPRTARLNLAPALVLDTEVGDFSEAPEPTDDDQRLRNDVTVSRPAGSSARVVDDTSVMANGTYEDNPELNVANDGLLEGLAGWRIHLGTVDEMRWPRIVIDPATRPELAPEWLSAPIGGRLTASQEISQIPGVPIDVLVEGWSETITAQEWYVALSCAPRSPWVAGVVEGAGIEDGLGVVDSEDSWVSVEFVAGTDTAMTVRIDWPDDSPWSTDPSLYPLDIEVAGVVLTVTAVSGSGSPFDPHIFTVELEPVNGVDKTIPVDSQVRLANPSIATL